MTATLVVRLSKKELASLDAAARKTAQSRSGYVRKLLREDAAKSQPGKNREERNRPAPRRAKPSPSKGVNWAEHFEWKKTNGQKVDWELVQEMRDAERNRWM